MQPIQMQFSKIQKSFSHFVAAFLEFRLNFEHLEKKMTLIAYVFWKLQTVNIWLEKCLKSQVWEDPLKSNMVNGPRHC